MDSLVPQGHLETELVERIALSLWRLRRVMRYERIAIEVGLERVVDDTVRDPLKPKHVHSTRPEEAYDLEEQLSRTEEAVHLLEELPQMENGSELPKETVERLLQFAGKAFVEGGRAGTLGAPG